MFPIQVVSLKREPSRCPKHAGVTCTLGNTRYHNEGRINWDKVKDMLLTVNHLFESTSRRGSSSYHRGVHEGLGCLRFQILED